MPNSNERLQIIASAILAQAENDSKKLIQRANKIQSSELHQWEDKLRQGMAETVRKKTSELRMDTKSRLAVKENQLHRELLLLRRELMEKVFDAARANLAAYTETPAYREDLLGGIAKLRDAYDHAATTVSLREADLGLVQDIRQALDSPVRVIADRSIRIGGFKLYNEAAAALSDETLDLRLGDARPWFLEQCKLTVH